MMTSTPSNSSVREPLPTKPPAPRTIIFVTELFHPSVGGQEIRFLELAEVFIGHGWNVEVLTIGNKPGLKPSEVINGIKVLRLIEAGNYQRPGSKIPRNPITILKFSLEVRRYLQTHPADLIMFNQWPVLPQLMRPKTKALTVHDWCEHRSGAFWKFVNSKLAKSTDKHTCVSAGLEVTLQEKYQLSNSEVIPSGIHTSLYKPSASKSGILFFGRLAGHKHPEDAIKAMIKARERGLDDFLTVAGGGPLLDELKSKYGHLPFIRILGRVSDELKCQLFADHRLYLLPSEREGFPRTIAESMACGTPVITTLYPDNGSVDVVRRFKCGVAVEPTVDAIADGILALSDPAQWKHYSSQGLEASARLDWDVLFGTFCKFVEM